MSSGLRAARPTGLVRGGREHHRERSPGVARLRAGARRSGEAGSSPRTASSCRTGHGRSTASRSTRAGSCVVCDERSLGGPAHGALTLLLPAHAEDGRHSALAAAQASLRRLVRLPGPGRRCPSRVGPVGGRTSSIGGPCAAIRSQSSPGHFPLCTLELLGGSFTTLTILRDPVERTLSALRDQQERSPELRGAPLELIYDDPVCVRACCATTWSGCCR